MSVVKDSTDFYEKMQEIQNLQHEREAKRLKLEHTLNSYVNSDQRLISLKARKLQNYWKKICQQERMSKIRNETIMRDVEKLEAHLQAMSACTSRLKNIRQQYNDYLEKQYPSWREQVSYISKVASENKENKNDYLNKLYNRKLQPDQLQDINKTVIKLPPSSQVPLHHQFYRQSATPELSHLMDNPPSSHSSQTVIPQEVPHNEEARDHYTNSQVFEQNEHYDYSKPYPYARQSSSNSLTSTLSQQQINQEKYQFGSTPLHKTRNFQEISPIPFTDSSYKHPFYFENSRMSAIRDERMHFSYSDRDLRYERYPFLAKKDVQPPDRKLFRQDRNAISKPKQSAHYHQHNQNEQRNDESGESRISLQLPEEVNKFNDRELIQEMEFNEDYMVQYGNIHEGTNNNRILSSSNETLKNVLDETEDYMEPYHQPGFQDSEINSKIHIHPFVEKASAYPNRKFKNKPLYSNSETYKEGGEFNQRRTYRPFVRFADPPVTQSMHIPQERDSSTQLSAVSAQETESELSVQSMPPSSKFQELKKSVHSSFSDQWTAKPPIDMSSLRRHHVGDHLKDDHFQNTKLAQTDSEILQLGNNHARQKPIPARRMMGKIEETSQEKEISEDRTTEDKEMNELMEDSGNVRDDCVKILDSNNLLYQDNNNTGNNENSLEMVSYDLHKLTIEELVTEMESRESGLALKTIKMVAIPKGNDGGDYPVKNESRSEIIQSENDEHAENEEQVSPSTSEYFNNSKNMIKVNVTQNSSKPGSIKIQRSSADKFGIEKSLNVNVFMNPKKQAVAEVDESISSEDSVKAALSLADLQNVHDEELKFGKSETHLDDKQISDENSDSDDDSLALQMRHAKETESEKSDKENSLEDRKGLSLTSSLSQEGLFKLLQTVEEKLSELEETEKLNISNKPSSDVIENILKAANSYDSLANYQLEDELLVILQQLPVFIGQLPGGCLFSEVLLQQFNIRFTESDVRNYIPSSSRTLWEQLYQHFVALVKSKILTCETLANLFGPLLINSTSSDSERKKAQLILRTILEINEDNDSDLSSVTLPSLSQNALPENEADILDSPEIKHLESKGSVNSDDSDDSNIPQPLYEYKSSDYDDKNDKNNEKPKKVTSRESDTDDDGDSFFDKVAVPLSATKAYQSLLDRTQVSRSDPVDSDDDDDYDIENELAAAVSQQSVPSSRLASSTSKEGIVKTTEGGSQRNSKIETSDIDDDDTDSLGATGYIPSSMQQRKSSISQGLKEPVKSVAKVISSISKPTEQFRKSQKPDYLRDSDTDSDVDAILKGKKEKIVDDDVFDFYD